VFKFEVHVSVLWLIQFVIFAHLWFEPFGTGIKCSLQKTAAAQNLGGCIRVVIIPHWQ